MPESVRALFERWVKALTDGDLDALGSMVHPEWYDETPQTGERTRGWQNMRAVLTNYPGADDATPALSDRVELVEPQPRWAMTPSYQLVKVEGEHETYTVTSRARYPDGSYWHVVVLVRLKDGKIWRTTTYYAPEFPAPEWRAPWVERMDQARP